MNQPRGRTIQIYLPTGEPRGIRIAEMTKDNLLGRWENYSKSGHGGNKLLRRRKPENLQFSILERMSPDTPKDDVIRRESTWKERLHSRTHGLNDY